MPRCNRSMPIHEIHEIEAPARRAIALDPHFGEALQVLAGVSFRLRFDWASAERWYRAAIESDPDLGVAHHNYGLFLVARGRSAEGLAEFERAAELREPNATDSTDMAYGWFLAGDLERALRFALQGVGESPNLFSVAMLSEILVARGESDEALEITSVYSRRIGADGVTTVSDWYAAARQAMRERGGSAWGSEIALLDERLGHREAALAGLAQACHNRSGWSLQYIDVDPRFGSLRGSAGFAPVRQCLDTPLD